MPDAPWSHIETLAPHAAYARWRYHRDRFAQTGLWPVIFAPEDEANILDTFELNRGATAEGRDAERIFADGLENLRADEEDEEFEPMDLDFDAASLEFEEGDRSPETQIAAIADAKGDLRIALLPCRESWEAPLAMGFGNWNDCPPPADHAAVLREWHTRHGAEPVAMGHDTIELLVRPIEDQEEAKRTAIEQYAYCPDIVEQGIGTVEALAAGLLGAPVWFFWWD